MTFHLPTLFTIIFQDACESIINTYSIILNYTTQNCMEYNYYIHII